MTTEELAARLADLERKGWHLFVRRPGFAAREVELNVEAFHDAVSPAEGTIDLRWTPPVKTPKSREKAQNEF